MRGLSRLIGSARSKLIEERGKSYCKIGNLERMAKRTFLIRQMPKFRFNGREVIDEDEDEDVTPTGDKRSKFLAKNSFKMQLFIVGMFFAFTLRSMIILMVSSGSKSKSDITYCVLGEILYPLGNGPFLMYHLSAACYGCILLAIRIIFMSSETKDGLIFIATLHLTKTRGLMSKIIPLAKYGQSMANVINMSVIAAEPIIWFSSIVVVLLFAFGLVRTPSESSICSLFQFTWFIQTSISAILLEYTFFTAFFYVFLTVHLIRCQYLCINETLDQLLTQVPNKSSYKLVALLIQNHNAISQSVSSYNQSIKWILLVVNLISAPSVSVSLYAAITAANDQNGSEAFVISAYGFTQLISTTLFAAVAGLVNSHGSSCYKRLLRVRVKYDKLFPIQLSIQLNQLIERVTSTKSGIQFTYGNISSYTSTTAFQYIMTVVSFLVLTTDLMRSRPTVSHLVDGLQYPS